MLDRTTTARLLYAVSRGDAGHAERLLGAAPDLDEDLRSVLVGLVRDGSTPERTARALGDALNDVGAEKDVVNECYRAAFYLGDRWAELSENPLYAYFLANRAGGVLHKWPHYFPIYHRHLERFRGRPVRVLEIGVYRGGGLAMWRQYFGPEAVIVGADIDEAAARATAGRFVVELGDQSDPAFLRRLHERHGPFDVVIDDGGHTMEQQIVTAQTLFPLINDGGVLLVEDTHTSYWPAFGGGLGAEGSFTTWATRRVDDLNAQHHRDLDRTSVWANELGGMHFYDSVVVFDRERRFRSFDEVAGGSSYILADQVSERIAVESAAERERVREELAVVRERSERLEAQLRDAGTATPGAAADPVLEERLLAARAERSDLLSRLESTERAAAERAAAVDVLTDRLAATEEKLRLLERSVSWRVTSPLRAVRRRTGRR
ncbi:class I SAM-dependent methyltransferase [Cellulomonas sp. zg-ZUI199]|uniref:Class I SAM-dependent methyltransferase n=1 Tax=Cellulomonas wangleii TaxID=2816956 RepID=A0ABX8D2E9_9CELL|nr:class I SAM-dependent methyltransferase [Cellulomonas wangleii]MBO0925283.1 class I SAM-dependent methyltransferase [Cellulomonas wangleii]QVI61216.1 class I SAM-dependent methyltransferase [Cellulomonas wangleii]